MNKQSSPQTKTFKNDKNSTRNNITNKDLEIEPRFAGLTKLEFTNWLQLLPAEERYLALKVKIPHLCEKFIFFNSKHPDEEKNCSEIRKAATKADKDFETYYQNFIDGAVFISEEGHLDCFGFDFSFVGNPKKLYECLSNLLVCLKKREKLGDGKKDCKLIDLEREEWIYAIIKCLEEDYTIKMKKSWDPLLLEEEKKEKKEFGKFWKNLGKQNKIDFLYLGEESVEGCAYKLQKLGFPLDLVKFSEEVIENFELDKKNICNKIFKCKLKKSSLGFCKYYEFLFKKWRELSTRKSENYTNNKRKHKKVEKKKEKSSESCSDETNETELTYSRTQSCQESFHESLEKNILECFDLISEISNKFYEKRVLAFERISAVFRLYGIECKLFGSCANGITIKNSDVDIAINQKILSYFNMYEDRQIQMSSAFEFMGEIFESLPWISNVKIIKTASTPIIKLTVNTEVKVEEEYFTSEYREILNRKVNNGGFVQADLTIEDTVSNHLGIVSTTQINSWLEEIYTLRPIIVLLKCKLAKTSLNETYLGGLNTYCLAVMLVAFIKENKLEKTKSLSSVFGRLLEFYGWNFDEKIRGIDIREKESVFYMKNKDEVNKFADLEIKDPLNEGKLMTKNCYDFWKIKEIFREIYEECFIKMGKDVHEWNKMQRRASEQRRKEEMETELYEEKNYFVELIL